MNIFSWSPSSTASSMVGVSCLADPTAEAARVAPILKSLDRKSRWLIFSHALDRAFTLKSTVSDMFANGPYVTADLAWFTTFYKAMQTAGVVPAWIILDVENAPGYFMPALPQSAASFYSTPAIFNRMSPVLRTFLPADYVGGSAKSFQVGTAFGSWCNKIFGDAIRQVVLGTYRSVFGRDVNISNFNDVHPSFAIFDLNSWPWENNPVSRWSSPACYLSGAGNRYGPNGGLKNNAYWNCFLDCLNRVRSVGNNSPFVAPWISYPSYAGDNITQPATKMYWLWSQLIQHIAASGVRTLLYWNPASQQLPGDDAQAKSVLSDLKPAKRSVLPAIPLDAGSVTTGSLTTTYDQFQAVFAPLVSAA